MNVPRWAGFVGDFPDDEISTTDRIEVFGGRNVAVALGEAFASLGCTGISEPWSAGEVGWEFDFDYRGRHQFWCRVQSFHPIFWLLLEDRSPRRVSKKSPEAHLELWRKFTNALEHDPRFDQIHWRPFNEGPPDWDEFTITADLPARPVLEELPAVPSKPRPKAAGGRLAPIIIGAWCALVVTVVIVVDGAVHDAKVQNHVTSLAIALLLAGLAIALPIIERIRKRKGLSSDDGPGPGT